MNIITYLLDVTVKASEKNEPNLRPADTIRAA